MASNRKKEIRKMWEHVDGLIRANWDCYLDIKDRPDLYTISAEEKREQMFKKLEEYYKIGYKVKSI